MSSHELFVVPAERHVERLARAGRRGETRASLRARLAAALLPDVRFADVRETRLTLEIALAEACEAKQLDLFAGASGSGESDDPLLRALRGRGGAFWVRAASAIHEAIGALRARGVTEAHLDRVRGRERGLAAARARTLAAAMRALDEALARAGARDGRLVGAVLAPAIHGATPSALVELVSASKLRARWLVAWEPHDLAWWRALDETLARASGFARVVLPSFDKRLEGSRERDPLEIVADVVARHLDAPPDTETIPAVLGDLATVPPDKERTAGRVSIVRAASARDEARVVARLVRSALDAGACVERIAIAYPLRDERTLAPLRRELDAERIVFHDALGAPPSAVPVVAAALAALEAQQSLDRGAVARVLQSGYVDGPRVLGDPDLSFRDAERTLSRIARALESRATAAGATPEERLVLTAGTADEAAVRRVVGIFARGRDAVMRAARVRAARTLFQELGFAARAGRGALATFARDEAPAGVERAERIAVARDVRAWEVLEGALDAYETAAARARAGERSIDAEVFRLELAELLDASAPLPGAGRAAAVRITRLADAAGDELDLLVVLDANDGLLPRDAQPITLISEALDEAVARGARHGLLRMDRGEVAARDLAALAMGAADAERVVLVTTAEDSADAPAAPSRIVIALERAGVGADDGDEDAQRSRNNRSGWGKAPSGCTQGHLRGGAAPSESSAEGGAGDHAEIARRVEREREREAFFLDPARRTSNVIGTLTPSVDVRAVVRIATGATEERPLAVTSLERFAQCPFKGYAHVVLGAREGEAQHELPDAREEGNLGHTALAAAFVATREAWAARPRDAGLILATGLAAADAALAAAEGHAPLRAIARMRTRESVRALLERAIADAEWDFILAEQAFGNHRPWPAFRIDAPSSDEVMWLRGSIDRVDRAHNSFGAAARVIDYKRGKSTVRTATAALGETALQVPIYAAVAARELGAAATGLYLPMQPRDLATESRSRAAASDPVGDLAQRDAAGSPIERRALAIVGSARDGRLSPLPAREAECTYCDVSGGCRKPRFAMAPTDEADDKEGQ